MKLRILYALCVLFILTSTGAGLGQQPQITDFNPSVGTAGDTVVINGSGFTSGQITVRFWNNKTAPAIFVASDSQITATVPSGITTGPLSIQSGSGPQFFSSEDFTAIGPGPYISGFSPAIGAVNDWVAISGVHFTGTAAVSFNGVNAAEFNGNDSGTQITVRVPPGATNGPVRVTTPLGTSNSLTAFTVIGPGPYISGFSPASGSTATTVNITGRFFTGAVAVKFNGVNAAFSANSDTLIAASAPKNVSTGPISVTTPSGSYSTTTNLFFAPPALSSFSPTTGRAGTNVTIRGINLLGATGVSFGGTPANSFTVLSNTNIQATVPSGAPTGLIRVNTPFGSTFSTNNFTVHPTIFGFSPSFGAIGSSVTITGANFNVGIPVVRFNGVTAAAPTNISFERLTARVPTGATTGPISLTTVDGSYTNSNDFFLPASVESFSPSNTPPGTPISIKGKNFIGVTDVRFGGVPAPFNVTNNTSLGATVPTNVVSGLIAVTTPAGTAKSTEFFYGAPSITNFAPTHGLPGTSVTIKGINFLGASSVLFNELAGAISSVNNTQLVATVPNLAQSGPITVTAPAGTNTSAEPFVLDYTSDLAVSLTNAPNPVTLGSNLVFTINVVNKGPYPTPSVALTNILPGSVELAAVGITSGWTLATNGNVLVATTGTFSVGASATLSLRVIPLAEGTITDTVLVSGGDPDPQLANNTAGITTLVQPLPILSIRRAGDQVNISWPSTLTNYLLESRSSLAPGASWSAVNNTPVTAGGLRVVTETNNSSANYYRLKK